MDLFMDIKRTLFSKIRCYNRSHNYNDDNDNDGQITTDEYDDGLIYYMAGVVYAVPG